MVEEIPQQARGQAQARLACEELQRTAGSRLLMIRLNSK